MSLTFFPISTLPAPYDVVWCRFPFDDSLGTPGPKPRPAIVLNIAADVDAGEGEVQLVYGTTKLKTLHRPRDFFVTKLLEMDACGLNKATRFDLDKVAWIPWAGEWFAALPGYNTPVIGRLTQHGQTLLQIELSYRQAQNLRQVEADES
ncbi:hypothetical protein [Novosphingobium sp. FSW06-99]|uniref:hypothetical protein n=1 Tax=Novosphingobium sp. FSW06-99 TaxID=1739113 RepID=UPI000A563FEF|nr:hypothetical protein [Novosphingobium sp. FSW06-99]